MKNILSLILLVLSVLLLFSNIQKTVVVVPVPPIPTQEIKICPSPTILPTNTPKSCPIVMTVRYISNQGIEFIKKWENLKLAMYNAPEGDCSIGWGHRIHSGKCNSNSWPSYVSEEQAEILLRDDIAKIEFEFFRNVDANLNQCAYDSMISMAFNFGWDSFAKKEFINLLETGQFEKIPNSIRYYTADTDGTIWQGLINRRYAEARIFEFCDYGKSIE